LVFYKNKRNYSLIDKKLLILEIVLHIVRSSNQYNSIKLAIKIIFISITNTNINFYDNNNFSIIFENIQKALLPLLYYQKL